MSEWEKVRLGDVCEIFTGTGFPIEHQGISDGKYPFYKVGDISRNAVSGNKYIVKSDNYINDDILKIIRGIVIPEDTVVFAKIGEAIRLNRRALTTSPCLIDNNAIGIKAKKILDNSYLYHFLCNTKMEKYSESTTVPSIKKSVIENIEIPLPPLSEQKKIADRLDKVSELIALRKKQAELLDTAVKARFAEMFGDPVTNPMGWDCKSFTDVCVSIYGGGTPSKNHPEYFKGNIPWVSPKDMKSIIIIDSIDHINETAIKNSSTKIVPENSILMVIRSGILKHSLPVGINIVPVTINQDMKAFIPNNKIKSTYLLYYFKAIEIDVLTKVRGVTADNIDFKDFLNRKIPLPPLALQNEFAEFVNTVEKTKVPVIKSIEALETLKKSLMQEYFG